MEAVFQLGLDRLKHYHADTISSDDPNLLAHFGVANI
jgi:hypothetical protein